MTDENPISKAAQFIEQQRIAMTKKWVPYQGPQGGTGWRNTETDEVTYDEEPPGQVSIDITDRLEPDEWDDAANALEGLDGGVVHDDLSGFEVGDTVEYTTWDDDTVERDIIGFTTNQGRPRAVLDERDSDTNLNRTLAPPKNLGGVLDDADSDSGEDYEDDVMEQEANDAGGSDVSVDDIDGWETMGDDEVRAVIDEVWDGDEWAGDGSMNRREIYDIIGMPPAHGGEYDDEVVGDVASTTSEVATNYGTISEFEQARESGSLDNEIEDMYESIAGGSLDMDAISDEAAESLRDEVRNHVVFDLIWHHPLGRSDSLMNEQ